MQSIDLTNRIFGRYTVIKQAESKTKNKKWVCQCSCGNIREVFQGNLIQGNTVSCGCFKQEQRITHGDSRSNLYKTWKSMKDRCSNPKNAKYANYGERGINFCNEWSEYIPFQEWALANGYKEELQIDRKNNDGGYSPDNCHWVSPSINCRNRRSTRPSTSQYIGVSFHAKNKTWLSALKIAGKKIYLGSFDTELEAAKTRDLYIKTHDLKNFMMNFN